MTDVNKENSADAQPQDAESKAGFTEEQFHELQNKLAVAEANLEKARKGETFNRNKRVELEKQLSEMPSMDDVTTKLTAATKELDELKGAQRNSLIDTALKAEIEKAGAKAVSTVLKLVDRSKITLVDGQVDTKSVEAVVGELKKTDAVLFEVPKTPDLKRSGEAAPVGGFKTEMAAAKTPEQHQAVMAKYGIRSTI
jgi:hypothetical protein